MNDSDIFLGLLAILFPPLAVWIKRGICSVDSLINICLCALGGIPGVLHAWYIITKYPHREQSGLTDAESGRIPTYVVIHEPQSSTKVSMPSTQPYTGYGATASTSQPYSGIVNIPSSNPQYQSGPVQDTENISGLPSYQEAIGSSHKVQTNK